MRRPVRRAGARGDAAITRSGIMLEAIRSSVSNGCDNHGASAYRSLSTTSTRVAQGLEPVARPPRSGGKARPDDRLTSERVQIADIVRARR